MGLYSTLCQVFADHNPILLFATRVAVDHICVLVPLASRRDRTLSADASTVITDTANTSVTAAGLGRYGDLASSSESVEQYTTFSRLSAKKARVACLVLLGLTMQVLQFMDLHLVRVDVACIVCGCRLELMQPMQPHSVAWGCYVNRFSPPPRINSVWTWGKPSIGSSATISTFIGGIGTGCVVVVVTPPQEKHRRTLVLGNLC